MSNQSQNIWNEQDIAAWNTHTARIERLLTAMRPEYVRLTDQPPADEETTCIRDIVAEYALMCGMSIAFDYPDYARQTVKLAQENPAIYGNPNVARDALHRYHPLVPLRGIFPADTTVDPDAVRAAVRLYRRADITKALATAIAAGRCVRIKECAALALTAPED